MNPLGLRICAVLALLGALLLGGAAIHHHAYTQGHDDAVVERATQVAAAIITRANDNAALAIEQGATNSIITKAKNEELAPVRERVVTQRVYVGSAMCSGGPAATTETESASGGDGADPPRRLVRDDVERDTRALDLAVEEDLATGRTCQAFVDKNGMSP